MDKSNIIDPSYAGEGIYRENILDHYKNPHNKGIIENPDIKHRENNPLCGDEITVALKIAKSGSIDDIKFVARGCAISIASMSMLSEELKGRNIKDVVQIDKDHIVGMLNIPIGPVRLKCALLGLTALKKGIEDYNNGRGMA